MCNKKCNTGVSTCNSVVTHERCVTGPETESLLAWTQVILVCAGAVLVMVMYCGHQCQQMSVSPHTGVDSYSLVLVLVITTRLRATEKMYRDKKAILIFGII